MVKINAYLIKRAFKDLFHFVKKDSNIVTIKNSIFDDDVYLQNSHEIRSFILKAKKKPKEVKLASSGNEIYYRNDGPSTPDWVGFWNITDTIKQRTADALVILNIDKRKIVLCHGHSHHLINPFAIESYFGLRTAINMIDPNNINSTDVFTPSEAAFKKRIKSDIGAEFADFDINTLNTLIKNIGGKVKNEYKEYLKYLDAADNLKFNYSDTPSELKILLRKLLQINNLDSYKKTVFRYLDNFIPIKDKEAIEELDYELIQAINGHDPVLRISTPVDLDHSGALCFTITGLGKKIYYDDFNIADCLFHTLTDADKTILNIDELKKLKLTLYDQEDRKKVVSNFPLYKCLYYERIKGKNWIFLESGVWYQVEKEFSDSIENEIADLLKNHLSYPIKYNKSQLLKKYSKSKSKPDRYENWFNNELVDHLNNTGDSVLLDCKNIHMTGQNKIEVCDVLFFDNKNSKYLFHNKYNYGSSSLSHLFSQGNVAAQLLTDSEFRIRVNEKIINKKLHFAIDDSFNARDYTIIYGIISKPNKNKSFDIPLFSKINLKIFLDRLRSMSYNCKICFFEEE